MPRKNQQTLPFFLGRLRDDIQRHYAVTNIDVRIMPDKFMKDTIKTVGAFIWSIILFSDSLLKKNHNIQTAVLVHEYGHRVYFPETRAKQEVYSLIAELAGMPKHSTGRFLNVIGDLIINQANLYDKWHKKMYRGLKESYFSPKYESSSYDDYTFFLNILNAAFHEYRKNKLPELNELETKAYHLLFEDVRPTKERVKDLAVLLKPLYCSSPKPGKSKYGRLPLPSDELPFSEDLQDDDIKEIAQELEDMFPDVTEGIKENKRLLRELRRRRALGIALPRIESSSVRHRTRALSGIWNPGKSVYDLDLKSTISSFGMIIPGKTTLGLKSMDGVTCSDGAGFQLTMILDISTSMTTNNRQERMIDAAVALNRAAKKSNYSVSIIVFGQHAELIQNPTLDHELVEEKIFGIEANQNDTMLYPALQLLKSLNKKPLVYILTDAEIYDVIERKVAESVKKITSQGKCIMFLIGSKDKLENNVKKALKEMKVEAYLVPDGEDYTGAIVESVLQS